MPTSRIPFHKKLFYTITSLFAVFVLTVFLFQYNREKEFRKQILNSVLQDYNSIINKGLSDESITFNNVDSVISTYTKDSVRITILDQLGNVLFDNGLFDVDTLKNHISRPEIKQALINGTGYALRKSETFDKSYFYASHKFDRYIIRTSLPFNSSRNTWLKIDSQFIYFLIISSLLVIITLSYFCAKLGKSISLLQDFSEQAQFPYTRHICSENQLRRRHRPLCPAFHCFTTKRQRYRRYYKQYFPYISISFENKRRTLYRKRKTAQTLAIFKRRVGYFYRKQRGNFRKQSIYSIY